MPPAAPAKAGIGSTLRKVPTWGWLVVGGAALGVGYSLYRDRRDPGSEEGSVGESDLTSTEAYELAETPAPIGSATYPAPIIAEPAETVGAVGQTALETVVGGLTGVIETIPVLLEAARPDEVGPPVVNVTVPASPPPVQPARPPAAPQPQESVTIAGKRFVGAYRYAELQNIPNNQRRQFNVYFRKPHPDQRWKYRDGKWTLLAQGHFG